MLTLDLQVAGFLGCLSGFDAHFPETPSLVHTMRQEWELEYKTLEELVISSSITLASFYTIMAFIIYLLDVFILIFESRRMLQDMDSWHFAYVSMCTWIFGSVWEYQYTCMSPRLSLKWNDLRKSFDGVEKDSLTKLLLQKSLRYISRSISILSFHLHDGNCIETSRWLVVISFLYLLVSIFQIFPMMGYCL